MFSDIQSSSCVCLFILILLLKILWVLLFDIVFNSDYYVILIYHFFSILFAMLVAWKVSAMIILYTSLNNDIMLYVVVALTARPCNILRIARMFPKPVILFVYIDWFTTSVSGIWFFKYTIYPLRTKDIMTINNDTIINQLRYVVYDVIDK